MLNMIIFVNCYNMAGFCVWQNSATIKKNKETHWKIKYAKTIFINLLKYVNLQVKNNAIRQQMMPLSPVKYN